MRGTRSRLRISILLLLTFGLTAMSQTSATNLVTFLTTNKFPDGSTIKVEGVSYGVVHRMSWWSNCQPEFFKTASPTIAFTTSRHAFFGRSLGDPDSDDLFTKPEALDASGNWRPLHHNGPNGYDILGPITEFWETWDFPKCPEPGAPIHVRIWATRNETNSACVEFTLPNDATWRERSVKEETRATGDEH
ncbi:MAG TPA: hypothetical protein VKV04_25625 [Verrucomicrobiae bacterium]|nr:hypothetical protein [Verrucomicrobiae bacterium]